MAYDLTDYLNIEDRPADYVPLTDFTLPMKTALVSLLKDDKMNPADVPYITLAQAYIIDRLAEGNSLATACGTISVPIIQHVAWIKSNKLYAKAIQLLKEAQAEQVEDVVWQNALSGSTATTIERMFALKSRKAEYKDNALPQGDTNISVRVTLEGNEIPTRVIEAESEAREE